MAKPAQKVPAPAPAAAPAAAAVPAPAEAPAAAAPATIPEEVATDLLQLQQDAAASDAQSPQALVETQRKQVIQEAVQQGADLLFDLTDPLVNKLLLVRCPVPEEQYRTLCGAYAAVIEKRWPGQLDEWGPEVAALALTVAIIGPRVIAIRRVEAEEAAQRAQQGQQQPAPAVGNQGGAAHA